MSDFSDSVISRQNWHTMRGGGISESLLPMLRLNHNRLRTARWFLVLLLATCGCADRSLLRPTLHEQPPAAFSESGDEITQSRWWTSFGDPNLNRQIEAALGSNYSLASAEKRVRAARALARREGSDLFGDLDGVVGLNSTFGPGEDRTTLQWGLDGIYPVDLWGEIQSRVDAEHLRADATNLNYHDFALTLSAEIARTWFALVEAHAQVKLLDEQIESNRTGTELQESRFEEGLIRLADVLRQRQLLESTLEQAAIAKARIEVLEHQLAILVGEMPQTASYNTGAQLPELPPLPQTGLPSELLQRRPDVRRDYVAFQAADRDVASAISRLYPRVNLTASLLNVADSPETVLRDWFVSIGGQLIGPLLDGGERQAEIDRTSAVLCELFLQYAQTMLTAFGEVEDALAREKYQLERIEHLENQVKLAGQSSLQLREQYLIGDAEYLDVLSASTGQQSLQRQLLSAQLDLVLIRVNLYRALAGDFDTRPQQSFLQSPLVDDEFDVVLDFEELAEKQEDESED
ncbi:TolC family protein [Fuerstiella marisgermanici]|uniref:Toluene efflux pump outer membrane protein TtgI n=1 Tax=Fuerstiella marisgermanici TaxID=1891926 RepID=A0A1P8W9L1_9PLAN|nr:TolC family protein [Fuerstiella marisgermanici]APZ90748.1 Toluene efflux pump outer membrane protein TtgI precursor [Fuerstiella marisgermanici]